MNAISDFKIFFEITNKYNTAELNQVYFLIFSVSICLCGLTGLLIRKVKGTKWPKTWYTPLLICLCGIVWSVVVLMDLIPMRREAEELYRAYVNKQYVIAEGPVRVIHQQPMHGHDGNEIIEVNGINLTINHFSRTNAYKQTIAWGGVLREGVYARIYYYRGKILRVDVRKPANSQNIGSQY